MINSLKEHLKIKLLESELVENLILIYLQEISPPNFLRMIFLTLSKYFMEEPKKEDKFKR